MYKIDKWKIEIVDLNYSKNFINGDKYEINPMVSGKIGSIDKNKYYTQIEVSIKSTKLTQFPFDLKVCLRAIFKVDQIDNEEEINEFLKKQGVHILYPYVRSTVSNLTQVAMMPPIVLPLINAFEFFKEKEESDV